jgi:hypothetical protein
MTIALDTCLCRFVLCRSKTLAEKVLLSGCEFHPLPRFHIQVYQWSPISLAVQAASGLALTLSVCRRRCALPGQCARTAALPATKRARESGHPDEKRPGCI